MTHEDLYNPVAEITHRNTGTPEHLSVLKDAVKMALRELSAFTQWWFLEVELRISLVASTRTYVFPTTDRSGDPCVVASFDMQSFRTKAYNPVHWCDPDQIARDDPDWTDTTDTGDVDTVTVVGSRLAVYKTPSAAHVVANPYLYCRGWRQLYLPDDDGALTGALTYSSQIDAIPEHWQHVLIPLTTKWVYRQARSDRWVSEQQLGDALLREMAERCVSVSGMPSDNIAPSTVYRRDFSRNEDYDNRR